MTSVTLELRDSVAHITLDDGKANALSPALLTDLDGALDRAAAEATAVVLAGRPGRFSAGFDLKVMMSGPEAARELVLQGCALMMRLFEHPQPVVGACTGHAIAGGALLLATCDRRIGANGDYMVGLSEVAKGLPVPIFAHELARARLDPRELQRAVLESHMYDPEAARAAGWLDELAEGEALLERAHAEAARIAKLPRDAFAASKRSLRGEMIKHVHATVEANLADFGVTS